MNNPINTWAVNDRPREKLICRGKESLSDSELLAIIIGSGNKNFSALDIAKKLLKKSNQRFSELSKFSIEELIEIEGIGEAKATIISALMEISRRRLNEESLIRKAIRSSEDAYHLLTNRFIDLNHEEFHVVYMNRANEVLKIEQISKGGLSGTVADGKLIFRSAIMLKASAMILAHNHPSGQRKPSDADKKLTKSLAEFGKMIDLTVLDHLIFCENTYFSFADEGLL